MPINEFRRHDAQRLYHGAFSLSMPCRAGVFSGADDIGLTASIGEADDID